MNHLSLCSTIHSTEIPDNLKSHRTLIPQWAIRSINPDIHLRRISIAAPDHTSSTIIDLKPHYEDCTM